MKAILVAAALFAAFSSCAAESASREASSGEPQFAPLTVDTDGGVPIEGLFTFNFWRRLREVERTNGVKRLCRIWSDATSCQALPDGCNANIIALLLKDGSYYMDWTFTISATNLPPLPRAGLSFTIPRTFTGVKWQGRGPWENYPHNQNKARFGTYAADISLVADKPDFGYRSACRWVELFDANGAGMRITAVNAPFNFSVRPRQEGENGFYVNLDAFISDVLKTSGPEAHAESKMYRLAFIIESL